MKVSTLKLKNCIKQVPIIDNVIKYNVLLFIKHIFMLIDVYYIFIEYKWPRLFECSKRHKEVKYDPDHIEAKNYGPWLKSIIIYRN